MKKLLGFSAAIITWWVGMSFLVWMAYYSRIWTLPQRFIDIQPSFWEIFIFVALVNIITHRFTIKDFEGWKG
jgi:hypothetical protein